MSHDPLLDRNDRNRRVDPSAAFQADASQGGLGNHAGPELALYRFVRWLITRARTRKN
jgi:hypothetical protein